MEIIAVELLFALIKQFARTAPMTIPPPSPCPVSNGSHCVMSIYLNGKRKPNEPLSMELSCCFSISISRTSLSPLATLPFVLAAHMVQIFDLTIRRKYNNLAEHAKVSQSPSPCQTRVTYRLPDTDCRNVQRATRCTKC